MKRISFNTASGHRVTCEIVTVTHCSKKSNMARSMVLERPFIGSFNQNSQIHLVAISGLHIGLVSGLVMYLAAMLWRFTGQYQCFLSARQFAVICGLIAAVIYALLAGMTIPTRRALIMLAIAVLAGLTKRKRSTFDLMILALSAVLFADPLSTLSAGFWLSFAAVFVIIVCLGNQPRKKAGSKLKLFPNMIARWTTIQIGLLIGLAPLLILLFGQVSLVAPLANLVAIPVIGLLVVPIALLGLFCFAIAFEQGALYLFEFSLDLLDRIWPVLSIFSGWDIALWRPPEIPLIFVLGALLGVVIVFTPPAVIPRWMGSIWILPLFFVQPGKPKDHEFRFTMFEVGHGLASMVETRNHVLIYDAGPAFAGGLNTGDTVLAPYLQSRGMTTVNRVMISHAHNDHSGGYAAINRLFEIENVSTGSPEAMEGVEPCQAGQSWVWDNVTFEILWPNPANPYRGNNASCVLKVSSKYGSLLLTGDIEKAAERYLVLHRKESLDGDVLQIPHQGSRTSSTSTFLDAVTPRIALLSSGYLNRFGHPHKSVMERYGLSQIEVVNTAYEGALTVRFAEQMTLHKYRDSVTGYWFY